MTVLLPLLLVLLLALVVLLGLLRINMKAVTLSSLYPLSECGKSFGLFVFSRKL